MSSRPETELMGVIEPGPISPYGSKTATVSRARREMGAAIAGLSDDGIWDLANRFADELWEQEMGRNPLAKLKRDGIDAMREALDDAAG